MELFKYPYDQRFGVDKTAGLIQFASSGPNQEQTEEFVNMTGDYDSNATDFIVKPPPTRYFSIWRAIITIKDGGSFDADSYGNGIALANGISIFNKIDGIEYPAIPIPIRTNGEWATYCYDITLHSFGTGDSYLSIRWTFTKHGGPIWLSGDLDQSFIVRLSDDFSDLTGHKMLVQGLQGNLDDA
jgi:hypothetical protein